MGASWPSKPSPTEQRTRGPLTSWSVRGGFRGWGGGWAGVNRWMVGVMSFKRAVDVAGFFWFTLGKRTWPLKICWWSIATVSESPLPKKAGTRERACCCVCIVMFECVGRRGYKIHATPKTKNQTQTRASSTRKTAM
jgi:hypothetical protein